LARYFIYRNAAGTTISILRVDESGVQLLSGNQGWLPCPDVVASLRERARYEEVSEAEAATAARREGIRWP
jgi:hypothetical protein